jgi:hypothetical protein
VWCAGKGSASNHFQESGRCLEASCAGDHVLVRCHVKNLIPIGEKRGGEREREREEGGRERERKREGLEDDARGQRGNMKNGLFQRHENRHYKKSVDDCTTMDWL